MKRISIILVATACAMPCLLRAQDAAVEERFNQLTAKIEILFEAQKKQEDRLAALEKELSALQRQSKPAESAVSQEDLQQLVVKLQEVDQNRIKDREHITRLLENLKETLAAPAPRREGASSAAASSVQGPGFEYVIQPGDTLSAIVAAYKEKNIKVTVDQIVKANNGLVPEKLKVGQKIFIPAPQ